MSYSVERPVQLGLCCMNVTLKKQKPPVYAARRIIVRMIDKLGIEELKRRILQNLDDLYKMLQWNEANGIRVFRLSSEMFQHKNNKRVQDYSYDFAIPMLQKIGAYAREKGHRLTFHPGQFNNLGSNRESVIQQTLLDLEYHADVLDLMGMGADSVMVIHGGGMYGDKPGTMKRWIANYNKLPDKIKRRLVLENCEKCYSIRDCLKMSFKCGVPVVLDTHHFECYKKLHPDESFKEPAEYIPFILETWADKGIKPKFHVSEQGSGKIGHHSDYIDILPEYLLEIPRKFDTKIDIMIEAKMKELSIQKLYEKYPQCNCLKDNPYSIKEVMNGIVDTLVESTVVNPDLHACLVIQKHYRGYLCRKSLISVKDGMTYVNLVKCSNHYNKDLKFTHNMNKNMKCKKIRNSNFPSHISENIAKFVISKKYKIMPTWDCKGDLKLLTKQLEVKGFMSTGPLSFGPKEPWDYIYFVDALRTLDEYYKVYEIKKSNLDFHSLKVSKSETFGAQCIQGRRPRLTFNSIKEQFGINCKLIFEGYISDLE